MKDDLTVCGDSKPHHGHTHLYISPRGKRIVCDGRLRSEKIRDARLGTTYPGKHQKI